MWCLQNHKGTTLQAAKSADVFIFAVVILLFMVKNQYQTLLQINDRECIFMAWNSCTQRWHPPFVENHSSSGWDAPDVPFSDWTIVLVSDQTIRAPVRIQPILNISLSCQRCNQMLHATYISFALFIIWNKVIGFVQWGRWWSLTELFLQLPKWGLNGKHGASRVFLYVKASVEQRWLLIRDVNLLQIGRFQFNNAEFHIHYWTQAFSFHCYYKCLDKIYKCVASVQICKNPFIPPLSTAFLGSGGGGSSFSREAQNSLSPATLSSSSREKKWQSLHRVRGPPGSQPGGTSSGSGLKICW